MSPFESVVESVENSQVSGKAGRLRKLKMEIYNYYVLKSVAKVLGRQEVIEFGVQAVWR